MKVNRKCGLATYTEWNNLSQEGIMSTMLYNNVCSYAATMHYTECGHYKNKNAEGKVY